MGTERTEWDRLISDALAVEESAENRERRLAHLERDILASGLTTPATAELLQRLYAEGLHD